MSGVETGRIHSYIGGNKGREFNTGKGVGKTEEGLGASKLKREDETIEPRDEVRPRKLRRKACIKAVAAKVGVGSACVEVGASSVEVGAACVEVAAACVDVGAACVQEGAACVEVGAACVQEGAACVEEGAACVEGGAACVEATEGIRRVCMAAVAIEGNANEGRELWEGKGAGAAERCFIIKKMTNLNQKFIWLGYSQHSLSWRCTGPRSTPLELIQLIVLSTSIWHAFSQISAWQPRCVNP